MFKILLYIDPGTGSMLFTVLLGLITTLYFFAQKFFLKLKIWISGGRQGKTDDKAMSFVIFSDDKRYWENFKGICDLFEERKKQIYYWTCSENDPALSTEYKYVVTEYIGNINTASVRLNRMKATVCLATTPSLNVYQWKRSRDTLWYVHLIHGAGDARGYEMFGLDSFDAVLVSGKHQIREIRQIEKLRNEKEKEIEIVGEPHIDNLYARARSEQKKHKQDVTILLAPSWGKNAILSRYGGSIIEALLSTGYKLIIRPHPQSLTSEAEIINRLKEKYPESDQITWNYDNDNFEALSGADIMISDFSSVIWDFVFVFDRPIIYADIEMDNEQYDISWTDEKRWEIGTLSRVGVKLSENDFDHLKDVIDEAIHSDLMALERQKIKAESWDDPGNSAEKIVDYLFRTYDRINNDNKTENKEELNDKQQ